ncbi:hypothetical protein ACFFX0_02710 [Citricoccus parietis]|uniref:Uncharacterized protein n=1 Tax=Citricoccus parietis TaxID=592307 RepID=A0ABV5FTZ3_9MICC
MAAIEHPAAPAPTTMTSAVSPRTASGGSGDPARESTGRDVIVRSS